PSIPCESTLTSHRTHPPPVIAVTKWRKSPRPTKAGNAPPEPPYHQRPARTSRRGVGPRNARTLGSNGPTSRRVNRRGRLKNKSRTGCYRFATQLSVTGGDRTGRQEAKANEIKCVPRLANTAWDRTNGSYTIKEWAAWFLIVGGDVHLHLGLQQHPGQRAHGDPAPRHHGRLSQCVPAGSLARRRR